MSKWTSWIEHTGDTCPVDSSERVKLRLRCGVKPKPDLALFYEWSQEGGAIIGITHYKRLKSNVEAEKAKELTPQPIITGVGEYRTRCGEKAKVGSRDHYGQQRYYGWVGVQYYSWGEDGSCQYSGHDDPHYDIIGPWEDKAEVEEKQELWAASFKYPNQARRISGWLYNSEDAVARANDTMTYYVGAVRLSHTEGK